MRWRDDVDPSRASLADLLLFSMISGLRKSRNYTKDVGALRQSGWFFYLEPWPVYIAQEGKKIDFVGGVKLKSRMETDRYSRNLGDR